MNMRMLKVARIDAEGVCSLGHSVRAIMETSSITLLPHAPEHLRALIEGVDVYERRFGMRVAEGVRDLVTGPEVSADFLARLDSSPAADPWRDGFAVVHLTDNVVIGLCSFTGPPGAEGVVEIAYGIAPGYQGHGYATEAAQALITYAFATGFVRSIRAHTLPEHNASTRVLAKSGFRLVGEITDSQDGLVWRWERGQRQLT